MPAEVGLLTEIIFKNPPQGTQEGNATDFGHTTLVNLDPDSGYLWVHITLAFCLFPTAIVVMRRFSVDLRFRDTGLDVTRTLAIERIPRHMCREEAVRRHFDEVAVQACGSPELGTCGFFYKYRVELGTCGYFRFLDIEKCYFFI